MADPYPFPSGSTKQNETTDKDGNRTVTYTDAKGDEHDIRIEPEPKAIDDRNKPLKATDDVSRNGKKIRHREYKVRFDPEKNGAAIETPRAYAFPPGSTEQVDTTDSDGNHTIRFK